MRFLLRLLRPGTRGRSALGAAVTDIPSLPRAVPAAVPVETSPPPPAPAVPPAPLAVAAVPAPIPLPVVVPPPAVAPPVPTRPVPYELLALPQQATSPEDLPSGPPIGALGAWGSGLPLVAGAPRVALGFRDGTETALEPGSEHARALEDLAQRLARRDVR